MCLADGCNRWLQHLDYSQTSMLRNFQKKKNSFTAKTASKKNNNNKTMGAMGKKSNKWCPKLVHYQGPVFDVLKIIERAIAYQKRLTT